MIRTEFYYICDRCSSATELSTTKIPQGWVHFEKKLGQWWNEFAVNPAMVTLCPSCNERFAAFIADMRPATVGAR